VCAANRTHHAGLLMGNSRIHPANNHLRYTSPSSLPTTPVSRTEQQSQTKVVRIKPIAVVYTIDL